jgi:hypothetical protein
MKRQAILAALEILALGVGKRAVVRGPVLAGRHLVEAQEELGQLSFPIANHGGPHDPAGLGELADGRLADAGIGGEAELHLGAPGEVDAQVDTLHEDRREAGEEHEARDGKGHLPPPDEVDVGPRLDDLERHRRLP